MSTANIDRHVSIVLGDGTIVDSSHPFPTSGSGGSGGGTSSTDEAAFTAGASALTPVGGVFNDSVAALTSGQMGTQRLTANRAAHVNLRDASGNELTPSTVSAGNSTTTPLAGGAPFTGTGEDVSRYAAVTVSAFTDQVSAASGLSLQWSSDNSNWDVKQTCSVTAFTVSGGSAPGVVITTPPLAKFFRLVYTNGATLQTLFRLQTIYHAVAPPAFAASSANQGVRPPGAVPMLWDSANDIYGPMRTFGAQPDNSGGSTAGVMGVVALNASSNPERARTVNGATATAGVGLLGAGNCLWDLVGGATYVRQAGDGSGRAMVVGPAAAGAALVGNPVQAAGSDGTLVRTLLTDTSGRLQVGINKIPGTVSAANSTTTPLTAAATFTGTSEDVSGYATIEVSIFADQASAVAGVMAQFSTNGTNWDVSDTQADQVASVGRSFFFKPRGQFFRFVYINGGTNQGAFRLQTVFHQDAVNSGAEANRAQNTGGSGVQGEGPLLRTVAMGAAPTTAITIGNLLQTICDAAGVPFNLGGHPNSIPIAVNYTTAQTDTPIVTVSPGTKIVVTSFLAILGSAATVNVPVRIGFGTANVPAYGSNGILGGHPNVAPGSGFGRGNGSGIVGAGADDEDLRITSGVPTGDSLSVMITYHTVPV